MNNFKMTCVVTLFYVATLHAQQLPLFTQYREMQGVLNPAAVPNGFLTHQNKGAIGISTRRQWADLPNSPTTQVLRGEYFFAEHTGVTLLTGGYFIKDQTGPTGFTGIYGRVAGVITSDAEVGGLSFGLAAGGVQYSVKTTELKLRDANDLRASQDYQQWYPDISLGAFWYQRLGQFEAEDYVYAGVSVPQMMSLALDVKDLNHTFQLERTRHYYGSVGWYHFFGNDAFIEPSAWIKYSEKAPINVDFNIRYQAANTFWIGVGSSNQGNIHAELGLILGKNIGFDSNFRFGYGFDYATKSFGPYVGTTHEINVSYAF